MRTDAVRTAVLVAVLVVTAGAGCIQVGEPPYDPHHARVLHDAEGEHVEAEHEETVAHSSAAADSAAHDEEEGGPPFVATAPVTDRLGPGGTPFEVARRTSERVGHQRTIGRKTYAIAMRSENLTYYPCSSCHIPGRPAIRDERVPDAHQDIQPVHPAENSAVCSACHMVNDPEWLILLGSDPVPLNEAYRLCAQCHFLEVEAWAGGAHGKRLDSWRGSRVVMSCTDCHNPHDPGLPTRVPYPGPRVPRTGPGH